VGTRARRAAAAPRMRELLVGVSWPALLDELGRQRLVPLLGARILEAAPGAPEPFARAVTEATRAARAAGELVELIALRIAAALEAAGIANVPLKGPLLARALHGDTAMRSSRDIDLLVARADLGASVEALAPLGWHVDPEAAAPVLHVRLVSDAGLPECGARDHRVGHDDPPLSSIPDQRTLRHMATRGAARSQGVAWPSDRGREVTARCARLRS